jgi:hypothetical protein
MDRESLKSLIRRRPFKPFRLYVTDGAVYVVRHPDFLMLSQSEAVIGLPPAGDPNASDAERFAWIDLAHITRVEPLETPVAG